MASNKTSSVAAMRYATALVDIAEKNQSIEALVSDMDALEAMLQSSDDLRNFAKSPLISREEKQKTVQAIAQKAKFQDITSNFLSLLAQNRRLHMISAIIRAIRTDISVRKGEVMADVRSAFPLNDNEQKELQATLKKAIGKDIAINVEIDKDLIGGMVVTVGSQMFDASVKRKLERLKIAMTSNANTNAAAQRTANEN